MGNRGQLNINQSVLHFLIGQLSFHGLGTFYVQNFYGIYAKKLHTWKNCDTLFDVSFNKEMCKTNSYDPKSDS